MIVPYLSIVFYIHHITNDRGLLGCNLQSACSSVCVVVCWCVCGGALLYVWQCVWRCVVVCVGWDGLVLKCNGNSFVRSQNYMNIRRVD